MGQLLRLENWEDTGRPLKNRFTWPNAAQLTVKVKVWGASTTTGDARWASIDWVLPNVDWTYVKVALGAVRYTAVGMGEEEGEIMVHGWGQY